MKKIVLITFALFYIFASAGINMKLHFCGGSLQSISFNGNAHDKGCCEKKSTKDCCKTQQVSFKISSTQEQLTKVNIPSVTSSQPLFTTTTIQTLRAPRFVYCCLQSKPPLNTSAAIHLLHGVLLI